MDRFAEEISVFIVNKYVLENGFITTAETVEILDVKHRRARAVLLNMVRTAI